jgi:hypothetical protein
MENRLDVRIWDGGLKSNQLSFIPRSAIPNPHSAINPSAIASSFPCFSSALAYNYGLAHR